MRGKPDFSAISDERLKGYLDLAQQMIFAYKYCDEEKTRVFTEVWKQLSDEYTERLCSAPCVPAPKTVQETENVIVHKVKVVKRIKR